MLLLVCSKPAAAQQTITPPQPPDTIRIIQIIKAKSLREKIIDSATTIETAAGDAVIKDGLTTIFCDSVIIHHTVEIGRAHV